MRKESIFYKELCTQEMMGINGGEAIEGSYGLGRAIGSFIRSVVITVSLCYAAKLHPRML